MTRNEAIEECVYLKSLFPSMAVESSDYWREKFEKYDQPVAHRAISRFADNHSDFIDRTGLLAELETQAGRGPSTDPAVRSAAANAESLERRRREYEAAGLAKMSLSQIDKVLKDLTDQELEELKVLTLEQLDSSVSAFLKRSDIHTGKTLRYHMANSLNLMVTVK